LGAQQAMWIFGFGVWTVRKGLRLAEAFLYLSWS
jgi:hypothetical protein